MNSTRECRNINSHRTITSDNSKKKKHYKKKNVSQATLHARSQRIHSTLKYEADG